MTATNQSDRSPAPGIIPEPTHLTSDAAPLTGATEKRGEHETGRGNPARIAFDKVMSALHGDKHMVDAYPTAGHEDAAPADDAGARARQR
jgi:hypothetical protein